MADLPSKSKPIGILQLPNEMIAQIIGYVPYRASVFQTCKKLNELCGKILGCSLFIDMETLCEETGRLQKNSNNLFKSSRIFKEINFIDISFESISLFGSLRRFFTKSGSFVRVLKFRHCEISPSDLAELLSYTPNLRNLSIQHTTVPQHSRKWKATLLNLLKLKTMNLDFVDMQIFDVLSHVKPDTLVSLTVNSSDSLIGEQTSLKELHIMISSHKDDLPDLAHTTLTKLSIINNTWSYYIRNIQRAIQVLPDLVELNTHRVVILPETFRKIVSLKNLKVLNMQVDYLGSDDMKLFSKMSLKKLSIVNYCYRSPFNNFIVEQVRALSQVKNYSLKCLEMDFEEISYDCWKKFRDNYENLEELQVAVYIAKYNIIMAVSSISQQLKSVAIKFKGRMRYNFLIKSDTKKLEIGSEEFVSSTMVEQIVISMPNLSDLHITSITTFVDVMKILNIPLLVNLQLMCIQADIDIIVIFIDRYGGNLLEKVKLNVVCFQSLSQPSVRTQRFSVRTCMQNNVISLTTKY